MDWGLHRFDAAVQCRVSIRPEYEKRAAKPEALALNGRDLMLRALWLMDESDPYPGEWALGDSHGETALTDAGITWIASGDVAPNDEAQRLSAEHTE
jgi:hypothetical protein